MTAPDIATHIAGYGPEPREPLQAVPNLITLLADACNARDQALAQIASDEAFARALERSTPTYYAGPGPAVIADAECARCHGWGEDDARPEVDDELED